MAPKSKPKRKPDLSKQKRKQKKRSRVKVGRTRTGRQIVTTDIGPRLDQDSLNLIGDHALDDLKPSGVLGDLDSISAQIQALGRATGAIVDRVVNSARDHARDPAEHILDLSKAYYSEESSLGAHHVQCDRCKLRSQGMSSEKKASEEASRLGWFVTAAGQEGPDHCPVCRDGSKLLKAGAIATTSPGLSIPEMILVTRLRWVMEQFSDGASALAIIENSKRSGRRSMLSNLCGTYEYEAAALMVQIGDLIVKHADVPQIFVEDTRGAGRLLSELFVIVKGEDLPDVG